MPCLIIFVFLCINKISSVLLVHSIPLSFDNSSRPDISDESGSSHFQPSSCSATVVGNDIFQVITTAVYLDSGTDIQSDTKVFKSSAESKLKTAVTRVASELSFPTTVRGSSIFCDTDSSSGLCSLALLHGNSEVSLYQLSEPPDLVLDSRQSNAPVNTVLLCGHSVSQLFTVEKKELTLINPLLYSTVVQPTHLLSVHEIHGGQQSLFQNCGFSLDQVYVRSLVCRDGYTFALVQRRTVYQTGHASQFTLVKTIVDDTASPSSSLCEQVDIDLGTICRTGCDVEISLDCGVDRCYFIYSGRVIVLYSFPARTFLEPVFPIGNILSSAYHRETKGLAYAFDNRNLQSQLTVYLYTPPVSFPHLLGDLPSSQVFGQLPDLSATGGGKRIVETHCFVVAGTHASFVALDAAELPNSSSVQVRSVAFVHAADLTVPASVPEFTAAVSSSSSSSSSSSTAVVESTAAPSEGRVPAPDTMAMPDSPTAPPSSLVVTADTAVVVRIALGAAGAVACLLSLVAVCFVVRAVRSRNAERQLPRQRSHSHALRPMSATAATQQQQQHRRRRSGTSDRTMLRRSSTQVDPAVYAQFPLPRSSRRSLHQPLYYMPPPPGSNPNNNRLADDYMLPGPPSDFTHVVAE